ncbi:uncharacterized protein [Prorops nasuta]|uniref:uncharacterized protein n=1 Tax=Prorops nasuta TaxID=863751 RepID=UPI0034CD061E
MSSFSGSQINLKSTAYNQSGQNYFEQLEAYNCMSSHLRRIHLAKSAVDTRNDRYMKDKKNKIFKEDQFGINLVNSNGNDTNSLMTSTINNSMSSISLNTCQPTTSKEKEILNFDIDSSNDAEYDRGENNSGLSVLSHYKTDDSSEDEIKFELKTISREKITDNEMEKSVIDNYTNEGNVISQLVDDKMKYVKFVYDITREIMLNELYTDNELYDVFRKHIEINKTFLDMDRMQEEIKQLKIELGLTPDNGSRITSLK